MKSLYTVRPVAQVGWRRPATGLLSVSLLLVAACGGSSGNSGNSVSASKPDYVIGEQTDLSGVAQANGNASDQGLKASIDGINRRGGVNGHKITLVVRDDASQPTRMASVFRELTGNYKVSAITGMINSAATPVLASLAEQTPIALLDAGAPGTYLIPPNPNVFGTIANLNQQTIAQLDYLVKNGKLPSNPKIAAIFYGTPAGVQSAAIVKAYAASHSMNLVASLSPPTNQGTMGPTMTSLGAARPDAIVSALTAVDVLAGLKVAANNGVSLTIPWANYSYGGGPSVLKTAAELGATGLASVSSYNAAESTPAGKTYYADLKADSVDSTQATVEVGYAVGLLVADVLKRCADSCPPDKFLTALKSTKTDLGGFAFGPMQFTNDNHGGVRFVKFVRWSMSGQRLEYLGSPIELTGG